MIACRKTGIYEARSNVAFRIALAAPAGRRSDRENCPVEARTYFFAIHSVKETVL